MIKSYLKAILMALLVMSGSAFESGATEVDDCTSACAGTPFGPSTSVVVPVGANCSITITYRKRTCGGVQELVIDSASRIGPCSDMSAGAAMNMAIGILVRTNMMGFQPQSASPPGSWTWRISRPACVSYQVPPGIGVQRCTDECCVSYLTVAKRPDCATWQITAESRRKPFHMCPLPVVWGEQHNTPPPTPLTVCLPACDESFVPEQQESSGGGN